MHTSLDSYNTSTPPTAPTDRGYLVPPPKQITDTAKHGSPKTGNGRINPDSYRE